MKIGPEASPALRLKEKDFTIVGAPWYDYSNITAHINTITENNLFGVMLTTWHTLYEKIPSILNCAKKCGAVLFDWADVGGDGETVATLLRKVALEERNYTEYGWRRFQVEI